MTITNLPSYPQQYMTTQYHLAAPASPVHPHPHAHVHPAHPHAHHQNPHPAYAHHSHPQHPHAQAHVLTGPIRSEPVTRKRPKYTRSKTGCLTCRVKKIKCDETKPTCTRCAHGQRECNWPENVPSRKKLTTKKQSEEGERTPTMSAESASPSSSSAPTSARDRSPSRKSPLDTLGVPEGAVSSRRTHSEPNTAAGSPMTSPIDASSSAAARRPSLPQNVHSSSSVSFASNSQQLRPQYPALTPPNVSPASFHPSPSSSHDYQSFNGSPASNGQSSLSRHDLPSIQTSQSRLTDLAVDTAHNLGQWHTSPMMTSNVDPIEPFFRTVQERNLIRHFVNHSSNIQLAVPSEVNPFLAVNLPIVLAHPPGTDPATEALRLSLLGVSAIHQAFLLARGGVQDAADETLATAHSIRLAAMQCLTTALTTMRGTESDAALGASVTIALIDIFAGGHNWTQNLSLAKTLVGLRGGPAIILARDESKLGGGVLVAPARLLLETLAIYEMFGCLTSTEEPTLLLPGNCSWWSAETKSNYQVQSVEKVFGLSRDLIPLIARTITYLSRVFKDRDCIAAVSPQADEKVDSSSIDDAQALLNEVTEWSTAANLSLLSPRVQQGNVVYLKSLRIMILKEALRVPSDDTRVQSLAEAVLDVCVHCGERSMGVDLLWPVIIAGSEVPRKHHARVLEVLDFFRKQCCYEIDTAERILSEVWSRRSNQSGRADWRSVVQDLDLNVLLL